MISRLAASKGRTTGLRHRDSNAGLTRAGAERNCAATVVGEADGETATVMAEVHGEYYWGRDAVQDRWVGPLLSLWLWLAKPSAQQRARDSILVTLQEDRKDEKDRGRASIQESIKRLERVVSR